MNVKLQKKGGEMSKKVILGRENLIVLLFFTDKILTSMWFDSVIS